MKLLILGGDGYLGWPASMFFALKGHDVYCLDSFIKKKIAFETNSKPLNKYQSITKRISIFQKKYKKKINFIKVDCANYTQLKRIITKLEPDNIIHFAEQPSAPYSMKNFDSANFTFRNNLISTFNLIWSIKNLKKKPHIIKLGTMGEYGTPNIDIEEGWLKIKHNKRSHTFLYPRQGSSLYHTTKVLDTDLIWFYVRAWGIKVTDLMQGPVYGFRIKEVNDENLYPSFYYDDYFGTVLNRFVVQAVKNVPLTVYGKGGQTRGYLNINDVMQCINLAIKNPPKNYQLNIFNQFTQQFTVNEIAQMVKNAGKKIGLSVKIKNILNPRKELEKHYYNAKNSKFKKLGLKPHFLNEETLISFLKFAKSNEKRINDKIILPRVYWNN
jgi:UDP-sulfoquinovose synthase